MTDHGGASAASHTHSVSSVRLASLGIVAGGALWGVFWVPVRQFEQLGFTGAWPGLMVYLSAFVLIAPFAYAVRFPAVRKRDLAWVGLLTGTALSFYSTAIILTDVLRAILFFYLTPVWGTVIGLILLNERLTAARMLAIVMSLCGLIAVVGFGSRSAVNLGDAMSLLAGFFWALGTYKIYRIGHTPALHLSAAFLLGSIAVTLVLLVLGGDMLGPPPEFPEVHTLWPYLLLSGLFAVPMILLTIWPASILTPGRIGILLMSEVVVGVASVAMFASEPFGTFEVIGTALILAASLIEVLGNRG